MRELQVFEAMADGRIEYNQPSMAAIADLALRHRLFLAAYRFRRVDPIPFIPLAKPLRECRVALVTTAALHLPEQVPFDEAAKGGDPSFRVIPAPPRGTTLAGLGLRVSHRSSAFDHRGVEEDPNLAFPLDRLRELEAEGAIGEVAPRHLSFMGSITAPGRLVRDFAPRAGEILREDRVDAAVLCPA